MGILDDAIREHLDLKRKHGARDSELRELESEALGSGEAPGPFAAGELFSEASATEAAPAEGDVSGPATPPPGLGEPAAGGEEPTRLVEPEGIELGGGDEPVSPPEGLREIPGQERLEEPIPGQERLPEPKGPVERGAPPEPAAEPPAPSESLEELISEEEPFPEDVAAPEPPESGAPLEPPAPEAEPERAAPEPERQVPEPPPPPPPSSEPPGRARGRVDVPTQEHPPPGDTGGLSPIPEAEPEPEPEPEAEGGPQLYDFETDEESIEPGPVAPAGETDDDFEALGPPEEEEPYLEEEEPYAAEEGAVADRQPPTGEEAYEGGSLDPEEAYEEEGDDLWFEKGPPQDFDFEDEDR